MKQLDDWENSLEQALRAYANPLPRPGFEGRLPALGVQPERHGFGWRLPLAVGLAACVAIATFYVATPRKRMEPPKIAAKVTSPTPTTATVPAPVQFTQSDSPQRFVVQRAQLRSAKYALARPARFATTFPAAAPLTAEEQRMQQLAQNQHVRFLPPQPEIQISALEISPLPDPQPLTGATHE